MELMGEQIFLNVPSAQVTALSSGEDHGRRLLGLARAGDVAGVRACMAGGAPFASDWLGNTPLHAAAAGDHDHTIRVLLRAGGSRDARTKVGRTPLHVACWLGHVKAVRALLAHSASVEAKDMLRMTPLHWAAHRGHHHIASLLLAAGADPSLRNKFHLTARQLAARAHHDSIVDLIDQHLRTQREQEEQRQKDKEAAPAPTPPPAAESPSPPPAAPASSAGGSESALSGEVLLRRHGITLLGGDADGTVLRALSNGRTVVLSDAGKLMLAEATSSVPAPGPAAPPRAAAPVPKGPAVTSSSMVVRATAVRSPPAEGTVFTLNARVRASTTKEGTTLRRVIHPKDLKLKDSSGGRVKIVMNRANFRRLVASANTANAQSANTASAQSANTASAQSANTASAQSADTTSAQTVTTTAGSTDATTGAESTSAAVSSMEPSDIDTTKTLTTSVVTSKPRVDELAATRIELATSQAELTALRGELQAARLEVTTLGNQLATTRNQLATARNQLATTRDELATTRTKLEQLDGALQAAGLTLTEWEP